MVTNARDTVGEPENASTGGQFEPTLLKAVGRWESLPHNQPLSDKTWVEKLLHDARRHFASAVRAR